MNEDLTILQASKALGLSKNTVKYRIRKLPEDQIRHAEDGRIFITPAGMASLSAECEPPKNRFRTTENQLNHQTDKSQAFGKPVQTTEEPEEPVEEPVQRTTGEPEEPARVAGALAALAGTVETLRKQLEEKDRQIRAKDQQIKDQQELSSSLARQLETVTQALQSAQDQAAAAQALHAGTLKQQLIESEAQSGRETVQNNGPVKKAWRWPWQKENR